MKKKIEFVVGMLLLIGAFILAFYMRGNPEVRLWAGLVAGGILFLVLWLLLAISLITVERKLEFERKTENFLISIGIVLFFFWSLVFAFVVAKLGGIIMFPALWEKVCHIGTIAGGVSIIVASAACGVFLLKKFTELEEFS